MRSAVTFVLSVLGRFVGLFVVQARAFLTPEELGKAYASAATANSVLGFFASYLFQIATDARSSTTGGIAVGVIGMVAYHLAVLVTNLKPPPAPAPEKAPAGMAMVQVDPYPILTAHEKGIVSTEEARACLGLRPNMLESIRVNNPQPSN